MIEAEVTKSELAIISGIKLIVVEKIPEKVERASEKGKSEVVSENKK